jgi:hypothetical protein
MSKKVAIVQSNYIPWKGYFDLINFVDEFILFDDVQYTRRDWRNRNRIKTPNGPVWLTIPVQVKGKYLQKIRETVTSSPLWSTRHWKTIVQNYSRAPYFEEYRDFFENLYQQSDEKYLSLINERFIRAICRALGIETTISRSSDYEVIVGKSERLVHLCKQTGADGYVSGPIAKNYLDKKLFAREHIEVTFMDYSGYPEYHQIYPPFEHSVSIIDLMLNEGPNARNYMKSF